MYVGIVRTVTTRDGSQQLVHLLDTDEVLNYNNDSHVTVMRDGVVMNVRATQLCDGDKILTMIPDNEFQEPNLF